MGQRKRHIIFGSIAVAIILCIVIYNLPYFAENRMYNHVKEVFDNQTDVIYDEVVETYLKAYPEGRHIDDVLILPVRAYNNDNDIERTLDAVDNIIKRRPESKFAKEAKGIYDSIWDAEITRYDRIAAGEAKQSGSDYVKKMLQYMKQNNTRTVNVTGNSKLSLKDFEDYSAKAQTMLKVMLAFSEVELTAPDDLMPIKDKITADTARVWLSTISNSLQKGFNSILTPGFIKFVLSEEPGNKGDDKNPSVNINYEVYTSEVTIDNISIPDIWVKYTQLVPLCKTPESLMLGIGMNFEAKFTIPQSKEEYTVSWNGNGGSESINQPAEIFYQILCNRCTNLFADKISAEFGIYKAELSDTSELSDNSGNPVKAVLPKRSPRMMSTADAIRQIRQKAQAKSTSH